MPLPKAPLWGEIFYETCFKFDRNVSYFKMSNVRRLVHISQQWIERLVFSGNWTYVLKMEGIQIFFMIPNNSVTEIFPSHWQNRLYMTRNCSFSFAMFLNRSTYIQVSNKVNKLWKILSNVLWTFHSTST